MQISTHRLGDVQDVHRYFGAFRPHPPTGWWFRGHADSEWKLIPKAGRPQYSLPDGRSLGRFRSWSRKALAYMPDLPTNDWERLAIAQHHGLATCLLDWTYNPLVALYFAAGELPSKDGSVFCYEPPIYVNEEVLDLATTEVKGAGFTPRTISPRILNQRAIFTVHLPVTSEVTIEAHPAWTGHSTLARLEIPADLKQDILRMLDVYGVNRATLFPDLEGLSMYVNWETESIAATATEKAKSV